MILNSALGNENSEILMRVIPNVQAGRKFLTPELESLNGFEKCLDFW